jgi:hypothetical protein
MPDILRQIPFFYEELTAAEEQEVQKRPDALRLMTHPGVGPITALAYVCLANCYFPSHGHVTMFHALSCLNSRLSAANWMLLVLNAPPVRYHFGEPQLLPDRSSADYITSTGWKGLLLRRMSWVKNW